MDIDKRLSEVGNRIKLLREKNKESQEKLGDAIGLSQNSISKIEKGETQLTLLNLCNIAEHYHVSCDYICYGVDNDAILSLLEKYISLEYSSISNNDAENFDCPILKINKTFFDYLMRTAKAKSDRYIPDDVREMWIDKEMNNFYSFNKDDDFRVCESVVPLPQQLLYPDDKKTDWSQIDLLREMDRLLLVNSKNDTRK